LYPRGKGDKIQEEKDESDMTEEDFSEAMLPGKSCHARFFRGSAKPVTCFCP
jgi:hypothetical protein